MVKKPGNLPTVLKAYVISTINYHMCMYVCTYVHTYVDYVDDYIQMYICTYLEVRMLYYVYVYMVAFQI